ncbi:MAG: VOC family protein [Bacteroidetes bacterium]|nr:VOC family protein [Bacteroidota bacterium]
MNPIYQCYKPDGFSSVSPYMIVDRPMELLKFLEEAFYAEILQITRDEVKNRLANSILALGDARFMISEASDEFPAMPGTYYLYVKDVDAMHERVLSFGAKEVFAPQDMPYLDRQSGIQDPSGNYWWLSTRLEDKNYF